MELIVLGSSHGVPEKDRFCSSTLLRCGDTYYMIDAGAPVSQLLIRYDVPYESLRAIFLTHCHGDHMGGLMPLLSLCSWYYSNSKFDTYFPDENRREAVIQYMHRLPEDRLKLHTYTEGVIYEDENITVRAVLTNHCGGHGHSYAFIIDGEGQRVIFTGDLQGGDPQDFPQIAIDEKSDAIICELAHFRIDAVVPYLQKCRTGLVMFNHYNETWSLEDLGRIVKDNPFECPVKILRDGDRILI